MRIALSVLAFLAVLIQPLLRGQTTMRLLRPGSFLIEPPRILPTEQWFGLRRAASGWSLIRVAPKITAAQPICGDRATLISVDGSNDVLILLTGVRNLSEGPVTAAIDRPRFVYTLARQLIRENRDDVVFENYTLWIRHGRERQQVASFERNVLERRQVVWAGDIDRDARPDLLFDFPLGDAGHNYVLFLSSLRTGDQLVSQAASFSNPGC